MKCKCGRNCIYYPKLEAWLCLVCDWKDIEKASKESAEKLTGRSEKG